MSTVSLYKVSLLVCDSDISEVNSAERCGVSTVSLYNVSLLVCDSDISEVNNAEGVECPLSVCTMSAF